MYSTLLELQKNNSIEKIIETFKTRESQKSKIETELCSVLNKKKDCISL